MSEYTKDMTISEMREEIAEMLQCGEGFIATEEKLIEYVDDFIAKIRADAIEEYNKKLNTSMDTLEEKLKDKEIRNLEDVTLSIRCGMNLLAEQLKSQTTETWHGYHNDLEMPKGTFNQIFNDCEENNDV